MQNDLPYQTLHCHTTTSDGLLSYEEVLDACQSHKIGVVAFTDHNSLIPSKVFEQLKTKNHRVRFISGIEFTCNLIPGGNEDGGPFEVVGLFLDPTNKEIIQFLNKESNWSRRKEQEYINGLNKLGFLITYEEVLKVAGKDNFGRPHLVQALKNHPENFNLLDKFVVELKKVAKTDNKRAKQLDEILNRPNDQKWYQLILSPGALHEVFPKKLPEENTTLEQIVKLIREAGGVAMIPHYSYFRDYLPIKEVENLLKNKDLDGMETVFGYGDSYRNEIFKEDIAKLIELCVRYNGIQGGGGDFHKPEEFDNALLPENTHLNERTINLAEKILEMRPDIKTTWSTL